MKTHAGFARRRQPEEGDPSHPARASSSRRGSPGFPFVDAAMRELAATRVVVDPAQNEGNWQWVAGTGIDARPWFRILNPERQRERFDPDLAYCRAWEGEGYPEPMLDLEIEAAEAKERFRAATL